VTTATGKVKNDRDKHRSESDRLSRVRGCGNMSTVTRLGYYLLVPVLAACTGEIESENLKGLTPQEAAAQTLWVEKALPVFASAKYGCMGCHDGSNAMAPAYLAGADDLARRETLVAFVPRVVNLGAPQSSRMLTVGDHRADGGGPALDATDASAILSWIRVEKNARPQPDPIRTAQTSLMVCTAGNPGDPTCPINQIDLGGIGPTPVAATLEFVVQSLGNDAYFTLLKVKAGAEGVYFEHPLLESWPTGATEPTPDPVDQFFAVTRNIAPNGEALIGSGTASVVGFNAGLPFSIRFDVIEKQRMPQ
jgi:hypothetical protein